MKRYVKTILFFILLVLLSGCSSTKCAERRIQRIVKKHPELIEVKLRTLDTLLTVKGFKDQTVVPMSAIIKGETLYETTEHGVFTIHVENGESLCIDFAADSQLVRFQDTMKYRQVVVGVDSGGKNSSGISFWHRITEWITFIFIGSCITIYLFRRFFKK